MPRLAADACRPMQPLSSAVGTSVGFGAVGETDLIGGTISPATVETIARDLRALGVVGGDVLIVHSSLRSIGWVAGGAAAVVDALIEVVGPDGTVSMPSHSSDWSDPATWVNPPVPPEWWDVIVAGRPAFDPYATPMCDMGAIAENLLVRRHTVRSPHPLHSQMAHGRHAELITGRHPLEDSFGDGSPLGRLYELHAKVLLVGVGHARNTSLHLAEARATWEGKRAVEYRSTVMTDAGPTVTTWHGDDVDADDFDALGTMLDDSGLVTFGHLGQAPCRVASMRAIVDLAIAWFEANRGDQDGQSPTRPE